MYGIVNKAIEELVTHNFGSEKWEAVLQRSGVEVDFFVSNEAYDDAVTYRLAQAAAEELGLPLETVLQTFGEFWVLHTGLKNYGALMRAGGNDLREFLMNLPNFHSRVFLIYPKLTPPEFQVTDVEERALRLHYFSHRPGLREFVRGLLTGIGKMYGTQVQVQLLESREDGSDHEVFYISW